MIKLNLMCVIKAAVAVISTAELPFFINDQTSAHGSAYQRGTQSVDPSVNQSDGALAG